MFLDGKGHQFTDPWLFNWTPSCFPYLPGRSLHEENGFSVQAFRFLFHNIMSQPNWEAVTWPSFLSSFFPSFLLSFPPSSPFPSSRMCIISIALLEAGLLLSTGLMEGQRNFLNPWDKGEPTGLHQSWQQLQMSAGQLCHRVVLGTLRGPHVVNFRL